MRTQSMLARLLTVAATLAALVALGAPGAHAQATDQAKVDVCGILPGDGAYGYVKAWNISCSRARQVAENAHDRFCPEPTCPRDETGFVTGEISFHGWDCALKFGYEFSRIRCEKAGKRFVQESAA